VPGEYSLIWLVGTQLIHKNSFVWREQIHVSIENKTMSDEKWIVSDMDHLGGKPRVQGTRISVAFFLNA
jgi:hypothetical protein